MKKSLVLAFKDCSDAMNSAELMLTQALVGSYATGVNTHIFIYYFFPDTPVFRAPNFFSLRSFFSSDHLLHNPQCFLSLSDCVDLISATLSAHVIIG